MTMILSASAIAAVKSCPYKYKNAYHYGIRKIEEPAARRMGTNWHEGLDLAYMKCKQPCPNCSNKMYPEKTCLLCEGTGFVADPLDAVTRMLSYRYANWYPGLPKSVAEVERVTLLYSLFAYRYHYDEQPIEVLAREIPFRIPLIDPSTRKTVPDVFIDGKIDKLIRWDGRPAVLEHKSTSSAVAPDSDYWGHLRLDAQTLIYVYAAQRLMVDDLLTIKGNSIGDIVYDVWHKPQTEPKKLSQADTKAFIESGDYFGRKFDTDMMLAKDGEYVVNVMVDGEPAEHELLKSGAPVIRETPEMYGCRLFGDIESRPDYYFARKLLTRSSVDLERFEWELFNLYQSVKSMIDNDSWYHNENSCDTFGKCDYCQFCYSGIELDPEKPPVGFKNIHEKEKK